MSEEERIIVTGGGVIGLTVARALARAGARVLVLDRGIPGREASWAAAGMLSPFGEASTPGAFLEFARESFAEWPAFARELEDESGLELDYRACGKVRVDFTPSDERESLAHLDWSRRLGADSTEVDQARPRALVPGINPSARRAIVSEDDHRVDNRVLGEALRTAAERCGVTIRTPARVDRLVVQGSRVRAVELSDGTRLAGGTVVLAAGCWAGEVRGLPRPMPIRPVRGQMLALAPRGPVPDRILESGSVYLVPRGDGRVLVGATVEEAGFQAGLTASGVLGLLEGAIQLVPGLADAPLVELWSGLRPGTPDGMPILGADPETGGVFHAGGHFRNGILLAPATGTRMAALILSGDRDGLPEAFSPSRFGGAGTLVDHGIRGAERSAQ